jgi:1-acyl-sn-glycerol-3-phosphate acyltransferase
MAQALDEGASLIIFPEGTRNTTEDPLLPFKSGLYHLGRARPQAELVPVWMENQGRVLPKGETIPVPLLCSINFGAPLQVGADEDKARFLERARQALLDVAAQARPS